MATVDWKEYINRLNAELSTKCLAYKSRIGECPFVMNMRLYCSYDCATANEKAIKEQEFELKRPLWLVGLGKRHSKCIDNYRFPKFFSGGAPIKN